MTTQTLTADRGSYSASRFRVGTAFLWVLQIASAAMFLLSGSMKLAGAAPMVQMFAAIGIGQWFRYATGAIEVVSALLLLVPSLAGFAALALVATMIGAIVTHLFIIGGNPLVPVMLLAATGTIAWVKRSGRDGHDRVGASR